MAQKKDEQDTQATVSIKYEYSSQYNNYFINGAYGSLTPNRKILLDFYAENFEYPSSEERNVTPEGGLGKLIKLLPEERSIIRKKVTGIMMDIETAESIVGWLNTKIKEHKAISKEIAIAGTQEDE